MLSIFEIFSIYFKWEDMRYIKGNEDRNVSCKSKQVELNVEEQFWLPTISTWDALKLVRTLGSIEFKCMPKLITLFL